MRCLGTSRIALGVTAIACPCEGDWPAMHPSPKNRPRYPAIATTASRPVRDSTDSWTRRSGCKTRPAPASPWLKMDSPRVNRTDLALLSDSRKRPASIPASRARLSGQILRRFIP
jgi:hypothetical protein